MPKITLPTLPLSALFAVAKPSGPSSMAIVDDIKMLASASRLFVDEETARANAEVVYGTGGGTKKEREKRKWGRGKKATRGKGFEVKIGQGGTLDPLADGVLVIGIGKGTKKLGTFLDCTKEYRATCLLGSETDSYDSEGSIVQRARWKHVTPDAIRTSLSQFRGDIEQKPPIFSALKMDGKPLYEYARSGRPLPRPIDPRQVCVHRLEMTRFDTVHGFTAPKKVFSKEERENLERCLRGVSASEQKKSQSETQEFTSESKEAGGSSGSTSTAIVHEEMAEDEQGTPPTFTLEMRVSGGTYVRSLAHDVGHSVKSAAHVVTLTRTRQGRFVLDDQTLEANVGTSDSVKPAEQAVESESGLPFRTCVPWDVFEHALSVAPGLNSKSAHKPTASKNTEETISGEKEGEVVELTIPDSVADAVVGGEGQVDDGVDEDGWRPWERAVMEAMEIVDGKK